MIYDQGKRVKIEYNSGELTYRSLQSPTRRRTVGCRSDLPSSRFLRWPVGGCRRVSSGTAFPYHSCRCKRSRVSRFPIRQRWVLWQEVHQCAGARNTRIFIALTLTNSNKHYDYNDMDFSGHTKYLPILTTAVSQYNIRDLADCQHNV